MGKSLEKKVLQVIVNSGSPLVINQILKNLYLPKSTTKIVKEVLKKLVYKNKIKKSKNNLYWNFDNINIVLAEIEKVNKTFCFVKVIETNEKILIPGRYIKSSLPGDRVFVQKIYNGQGISTEGKILDVETISEGIYFGKIYKIQNQYFFSSSEINFPLTILPGKEKPLKDNTLVKVKIIYRGIDNYEHIAKVISVIGDSQNPEDCCELILSQKHINIEFDKNILEEAQLEFNKGVPPSEYKTRLNLTNELIFTIDSKDSKDLDDAISIKKINCDNWQLGVHIADVSYYVKQNSLLDKEAYQRGTSVYYVNSVIPMLPESLSNGICSLHPNEDRLAFSIIMNLNKNGDIISYNIAKTIINSKVKGVYSEVNQILNNTASQEIKNKYSCVFSNIFLMEELATILSKKRFERGSLNLETPECKISFNNNNINIEPYLRGSSEALIEEFMLKANEAAAMFSKKERIPFIYRIHEQPPEEKFSDLCNILQNLNLPKPENKSQIELSKVLKSAKKANLKFVVNNIVLRSLAKARYSAEYKPHYGLVLNDYSHFTSPIRRYPDLMIHRIMSEYLKIKDNNKINNLFSEKVAIVALKSSECEKNADNIERECDDIYKACYMSKFINQEFNGIVSGVTQYGLYVQLNNTVEGLVHKSTLPPGEYEYVNIIELRNNKDNKFSIKIGDKVKVKVTGANIFSGQVDFELIDKV